LGETVSDYRPHYLGQLNWYNLNVACETVFRAFESMPFLVGSALTRPDYRDVDIRLILTDDEFAKQFPHQPADPRGKMNDPGWEFICSAISEWLRARTGLPIDFQIQQMTAANLTFPDGKRNACGMFISRRDLKNAGMLD
jgi:hypothetical protein